MLEICYYGASLSLLSQGVDSSKIYPHMLRQHTRIFLLHHAGEIICQSQHLKNETLQS